MAALPCDFAPLPLVASPGDDLRAPVLPALGTQELVDLFLRGRTPRTLEAYQRNLRIFAAWRGTSVEQAIRELLGAGHGQANLLAVTWRQQMVEEGFAPKTISQRLSALRSIVKLARVVGMVPWTLEVDDPGSERVRDMRGPGTGTVVALMQSLEAEIERTKSVRAVRDLAIVHLLHDLAMRRGEVVALDVEHYDAKAGTLSVKGKGRRHEREVMTLPDETRAALDAWLDARSAPPGTPLFVGLSGLGKRGGRLHGRSLARALGKVAERAHLGVVRPHGLRHTAITTALEVTDGNVREVQRFSRLKNVATIAIYDDERRDVRGEVAKLVAKRARAPRE